MISAANIRKYNRWQAFASHLALSLLILLGLASLIAFYWFPGDLIHAGGWQGIKIVAAIDIVLGPFLTLLVFNPQKKSLIIDLCIILAIQTGALGYGLYSISQERPGAVILTEQGLHILPMGDLKELLQPEELNELKKDSLNGIYYGAIDLIKFAQSGEWGTELFSEENLPPIYYRPSFYTTYLKDDLYSFYVSKFELSNSRKCLETKLISKHISSPVSSCILIKNRKIYKLH